MIALYITETKAFMASLLTTTLFDDFLLHEGQVTTFCTYTIDGAWHSTYADPEHKAEASPVFTAWSLIKPHIHDMIRGKHTPLGFKLILEPGKEQTEKLLNDNGLSSLSSSLYALFLNLRFDGRRILLTTGSSQSIFPADKTIDRVWDQSVYQFLRQNHFSYDEQ